MLLILCIGKLLCPKGAGIVYKRLLSTPAMGQRWVADGHVGVAVSQFDVMISLRQGPWNSVYPMKRLNTW